MAESLVIKINGNVKGYQEALKSASTSTKSLEDGLKDVAKTAGIAFAALSATIVGTVSAYRTQEQAERKIEQTIRATGGAAGYTANEIFKMASGFQEASTYGDEVILGGQNILLTFKNLGKDTFPRATQAMLDMSTTMGTDLKSSAIQLGKALNDPTQGISALTRVGVTFSTEQKKMIKNLQAIGDVAGAQAVILKELESEFGGSAKAAAGGTGAFIQLKNSVGDLVENIGAQFAPVLIKASNALKKLVDLAKNNPEFTKLAAAVLAIGTALAGIVFGLAAAGAAFIKFRAIMIASKAAMGGITFSLRTMIGSTGIGLLLIVLGDLALNWDKRFAQMSAIFRAFASNMTNIGSGLGKFLTGIFTFDKDKIVQGLNEVKKALKDSFNSIKNDPSFSDTMGAGSDTEKAAKNARDKGDAEIEQARITNEEILKLQQDRAQTEEELRIYQSEGTLESYDNDFAMLQEKLGKEEAVKLEAMENMALAQEDYATREFELAKVRELKKNALAKKALADEKKMLLQREQSNAATNQAISDGGFQVARALVNASGQSAKTQFAIQQALGIAQILINGYMAATLAMATIPPPFGEAVAAERLTVSRINAAAAAGVGFIQYQGMANGGLVTGGIPGVDSVPIMAQRNEIVAPSKNFEEVIGSVRAKREAENLNGNGSFGNVRVEIGFDGDQAASVLTAKQTERRSLGISQVT